MVKQGVVFPNGYSLFADVKIFIDMLEKYPTTFALGLTLKENMGVSRLPPVVG